MKIYGKTSFNTPTQFKWSYFIFYMLPIIIITTIVIFIVDYYTLSSLLPLETED